MELGGNITLSGFDDRDYAELIVVKKIVGRYARMMTDHHAGFERLSVSLRGGVKGSLFEISSECRLDGRDVVAESSEQNLFVALDDALKRLLLKIEHSGTAS